MPTTVRFVPNPVEMRRLTHGWDGIVGRDLDRRLNTLAFRARLSAGVDTGELRGSLGVTERKITRAGLEGRVGSGLRYAGAHHEGAKPHVIRARRARFLRFAVGGRIEFRTSVHHPGNRPNPYLARWLREAVR